MAETGTVVFPEHSGATTVLDSLVLNLGFLGDGDEDQVVSRGKGSTTSRQVPASVCDSLALPFKSAARVWIDCSP